MSELCCNFQASELNTVDGVGETGIVLQSVTDRRTYVRKRVKPNASPHFVAGAQKERKENR